ncbi:Hypothetical predicted protein [Paramuricea clavata]|uniref:Uncharacterized protein n=1 Tax=Paramuricea clavata TaxID=317549 RepID=A0A6S7GPM6_PARCT|nr:Hypothetical predicted protein [Paramuricea clavata]
MENLLQGIPFIVVRVDDSLVSGSNVEEHLANLEEVLKRLPDHWLRQKKKKFAFMVNEVAKSVEPDEFPNRVLKEFAPELSPVISPIPKVTPPQSIESDLRPISLTCNFAKIMEGCFCKRLLSQLTRKSPASLLRGFDRIDHHVLIEELMKLDIHPILYNWINAFLSNRKQAVRIGGTLSDWKSPNGGIPQGTKLGVILFSVMTNKLISDWHLRTKFVDDIAALEIIPRNSISYLNNTVDGLYQFSVNHNMSLNPLKCKEMVINFMNNNSIIVSNVVERVTNYKLLGVQLSEDHKWNKHVDYIYKKACKKLYSLRVLRRAGVQQRNILKVDLTTIRPVLEYAVPVWQAIPVYLSERLESIQRRALRIIFPSIDNYDEAMMMAQTPTLKSIREQLCKKYMTKMKKEDHSLHFMLQKPKMSECSRPLSETLGSTPVPEETVLLMELLETTPIRAEQVKNLAKRTPVLAGVLKFPKQGCPSKCPNAELRPYFQRRDELSVQDDCIFWGVVVSPQGRRQVVEELHETDSGICKMNSLTIKKLCMVAEHG